MSVLQAPSARDAVAASQRARMLRAIVEAVAEKGYASTVVADVVGRAGVSRKTFYEQFDGLLECFLAAYDECLEVLRAELAGALDPGAPLTEQLHAIVESYLGLLAREPELARTYLVEAYAAGRPATERRQRTLAEFGTLLAELHGHALDDIDYELAIGSVIAAATARVAADRTAELPALAAPLHAHLVRTLGL